MKKRNILHRNCVTEFGKVMMICSLTASHFISLLDEFYSHPQKESFFTVRFRHLSNAQHNLDSSLPNECTPLFRILISVLIASL